jgi:hypothetical protein
MLLLQAEKEIRHFNQNLHVQIENKPRSPRFETIILDLTSSRLPFFSFPPTFKLLLYFFHIAVFFSLNFLSERAKTSGGGGGGGNDELSQNVFNPQSLRSKIRGMSSYSGGNIDSPALSPLYNIKCIMFDFM